MKDKLVNLQGLDPKLADAERMHALAGLVGPVLGEKTMEFVEADYVARIAARPAETEAPNVGGIPVPEHGTIKPSQPTEQVA